MNTSKLKTTKNASSELLLEIRELNIHIRKIVDIQARNSDFLRELVDSVKERRGNIGGNLTELPLFAIQKKVDSPVDDYNKVIFEVLKNLDSDCLGKYIVIDPTTKKYEIDIDSFKAEKRLEEKLTHENLLTVDTIFFMAFIDEIDFERSRAA